MKRCRRIRPAAIVLAIALLASCEFTTYDYHNPLDPQEDARIEDVLASGVIPDAELESLIRDTANDNGWTMKSQLREVYSWLGEYSIGTFEGIGYFSAIGHANFENIDLTGIDLGPLVKLGSLRDLQLHSTGDPELDTLAGVQLNYIGLARTTVTREDLSLIKQFGVEGTSLSGTDADPNYLYESPGTPIEDILDSGLADQLNWIDLIGFGFVDSTHLSGLSQFPELESIGLHDNAIVDPAALSTFFASRDDDVYFLGLGGNPLDVSLLGNMDYITQIRDLDLGNLSSSLTSIAGLPNSTRLERLGLHGNVSLGDIVGIGDQFPNLIVLGLSSTDLSSLGPVFELSELEELSAEDLTNLGDISGIASLGNLRSLMLSGNSGLVDGLDELAELSTLEYVDLENTGFPTDLTAYEAIFSANPDVFIVLPDGSGYGSGDVD